jgi:hypothetical protein
LAVCSHTNPASSIGLSNPQFLAKTWGSLDIAGSRPIWQTSDDPNRNIYDSFLSTSAQALVILNLGSFVGGLLFVLVVPKVNRVSLQSESMRYHDHAIVNQRRLSITGC